MDVTLFASLAALALVDSTSFGTLVIPIWLLIHPGPVRAGRILVFLGTVAVFYFAVGVALTVGAGALLPQITRFAETTAAQWALLVAGVSLFFWSFRMGHGDRNREQGRMVRWRGRVLADEGGILPLAGLALVAALVEVATMLPYLGAISLVTAATLTLPQIAAVMAGYCLLMITPALALTAGRRIVPALGRISDWMTNSETMAWIVGIAGFLLAREAATALGLLPW